MRSMAARARALQGQRSQQASEDDALVRIARLQHIAMLQDQASQVIAAAEAALDQSLLDCPSLDEAGDGTLRALRTAH